MPSFVALVAALLFGSLGLAARADVVVVYDVDEKALKMGATAATPLTVAVHGDPACSGAIASEVVAAGAVGMI